jgi:hypothetical protein
LSASDITPIAAEAGIVFGAARRQRAKPPLQFSDLNDGRFAGLSSRQFLILDGFENSRSGYADCLASFCNWISKRDSHDLLLLAPAE